MYKDSILSFLKNGKYKSTYPCETFPNEMLLKLSSKEENTSFRVSSLLCWSVI